MLAVAAVAVALVVQIRVLTVDLVVAVVLVAVVLLVVITELRGQPLEAIVQGDASFAEQLTDVRNRLRDEGYATMTLKTSTSLFGPSLVPATMQMTRCESTQETISRSCTPDDVRSSSSKSQTRFDTEITPSWHPSRPPTTTRLNRAFSPDDGT